MELEAGMRSLVGARGMATSRDWQGLLAVAVSAGVVAMGSGVAVADPPADASPISPRGLAPSEAMLQEVASRAQQQYIDFRTRQQQRKAPDQVAARQRSRTAYRGMSRADAGLLARQQFPALVTEPPQGPLTRGKQLDGYDGDYAGYLKGAGPDGSNAMIVSGQPLRTKDAAGHLAPVDSTLVGSSNDGWAPRNPLERYHVGAKSGSGVTFPDQGVTVTPGGASVAGVTQDATILYANTQTDTDTLAKPLTDGVEYFWQSISTTTRWIRSCAGTGSS
jgi:hypothetical protein